VTATVALVHGAWHGAWCWEKVQAALAERDIPAVAIDLPGHGDSRDALGDLHADALAAGRLFETIEGDVVLCGHSYGGAVITQVEAHPRTKHLVYLAGFQLEPGESCASVAAAAVPQGAGATELGSALLRHDDGTVTLDPDLAARVLYNDCPPEDVAVALERLGPQLMASLQQPATRAGWHEIPSTYVVCTEDLGVAPALQRAMAERAGSTLEWPTSHSPFLSRPELVADLLAARARD
jgi:pimeloyl-ACP methyl ester carboxylesterase